MNRIWLVTVREVRAALAKRAFVIATALMVVLIVAGSFVVDYFVNQEMEDAASTQLGLTSELAEMEPALAAAGEALGVDIETSTMADRAAAEAALEAEEIDAFLSGEPGDLDLLFQSGSNQSIVQAVTSAAQTTALSDQITALGGDPGVVAAAVQSSAPTLSFIEDPAAMEGPQYFIAVVMVALLFFALVNSGSQIAIGVVEEKASRVVEILLATLRPTELFAGKVLGNGIVGLAQVVLYAGAFGVAASVTGMFEGFDINLTSQIAWLFVWFLLGFTLYAVLWGSLASLVSRQEDIGSITAPVTLLMLVPFYTAMFTVPSDPDGFTVRILSQVPFFAPFVMPFRSAFTEVPLAEMLSAVAFSAVLIPLFVWLAATVYKRGILHTGSRMTLKQALGRG